jgi:hypothetical protein
MKSLLINLMICLGYFHSNAQLSFTAPVKYNVGTEPRSICSGDFNNDGIKDLVAYCTVLNRVAVLTGNSNGSFNTPANYTNINNGLGGTFIMSDDFNNDGLDDLACANEMQGKVHILFGNGMSTFTNIVTYSFNSLPTCIACNDVDNDGKKDLIIGAKTMDTIYVMKGDGVGGFTIINRFRPNLIPWPINVRSIDVADLNNDGNADIVINESTQDSLLVYIGDGTGQFNYHSSIDNGGLSFHVMLNDFNSDGNLDLFSINGYNFQIFNGDGNGGFGIPAIYTPSVGFGSWAMAAAKDFNLDGFIDIATTTNAADTDKIYFGNSSGTYSNSFYSSLPGQQFLLSDDFNNDGKPDLAGLYADSIIDGVTVFLNKTVVEGTIEQYHSSQLFVYPNPLCNRLNIECDNQFSTIQVYNIFSELVLEKHYRNIKRTELDLSELNSGTYILKVDNSYIQRLTIKRE